MNQMTPHKELSLSSVLDRLSEAAGRPFEDARPSPSGIYHSPAFLTHERDRIFLQEWICVGRDDEIPDPGDYLTHQIADVPVFVLRQNDGSIRAFVNACAHRHARLVPEEKGSCNKRVTCPYHAWTYDLDGQLIRAPYMDMKEAFDDNAHPLKALHTESWEGFLYVTLAKKPDTQLSKVLAPFTEGVVGRYQMARYRTRIRETMVWNADWKNLVENFTESYHVPTAHGKTFAQHLKPLEDYICGEDSDFYGYHRAPQPSETGPGAAHRDNTNLEGEWRRMMIDFCIYPCHLVTLMPDYLWYISVQPSGVGKMQATWGVAFPDEILNDVPAGTEEKWLAEFKNYMDTANNEDKPLVEALFKGTRSPILPQGTLHPVERNLWQFTRYLNRKCAAKPWNDS